MQTFLGLLLIILLYPGLISANGGPMDSEAYKAIGEIRLESEPEVELVSEDLSFTIIDDTVAVRVKYTLKSNHHEKRSISYAFPIDVYQDEWHTGGAAVELAFTLNGVPLHYESTLGYVNADGTVSDTGQPFQNHRYWYIVEISMNADTISILELSYRIAAGYSDDITSGGIIPEFESRKMTWDFTPAGYWGDGVADKIRIRVDAQSIVQKGGSVELQGLEFTKRSDIHEFEKKRLTSRKMITW